MASLRASCIQVGPQQLPQIDACVKTFAQRLGLKDAPIVFIVESNTLNAAAQRIGARKVVYLIDDVVWGALKAGDPRALSFVIAHELAHHALGHTNGFRSYIRSVTASSRGSTSTAPTRSRCSWWVRATPRTAD